MLGSRAGIGAVAIAWLVAGCTPPQQSTVAELQALPPSRICQASLPVFGNFYFPGDISLGTYRPPDGRILTSSDGGWCQLSNVFVLYDVATVGTLSLRTPPVHGEVRTGAVGEQLRIAYRPPAGFTGTDGFVVHLDAPQSWDIPVQLTVVP